MNYLKEINAFYDRMETNRLSCSAISLWHALIHINNRAGWVEEFSVAVYTLCQKTALAERTIFKARNELKKKGYIHYKKRGGRESAQYRLLSLDQMRQEWYDDTASRADKNADKKRDKHTDKDAPHRAALVKQKESNHNKTLEDEFNRAFQHSPTVTQLEMLLRFVEDDHLPLDLVCLAMSMAGERGKPFLYAKSIVVNWCKEGVRTLEQAHQASEQFHRRYHKSNTFRTIKGGKDVEPITSTASLDVDPAVEIKFYK
ncbi:DnaD domain-containing protein [Bacillus solitudinis]|uniref:DnaD domain-containing protein n=1 Tax=Bacillus solitudinis TaxID=2014074 RepID=UPI000C24560E|nr:DnaD domain protein [Bacillus solitudinis]